MRRGGGYLRLSGRYHPLANVWRWVLGPQSREMPLIDFARSNYAANSIAIIGMAIAHFSGNAYLIQKENISITRDAGRGGDYHHCNLPYALYALCRSRPLSWRTDFDLQWGRSCTLATILVIWRRANRRAGIRARLNTQNVFSGLRRAYRGMADAFAAGVVMLLVAAGVSPVG